MDTFLSRSKRGLRRRRYKKIDGGAPKNSRVVDSDFDPLQALGANPSSPAINNFLKLKSDYEEGKHDRESQDISEASPAATTPSEPSLTPILRSCSSTKWEDMSLKTQKHIIKLEQLGVLRDCSGNKSAIETLWNSEEKKWRAPLNILMLELDPESYQEMLKILKSLDIDQEDFNSKALTGKESQLTSVADVVSRAYAEQSPQLNRLVKHSTALRIVQKKRREQKYISDSIKANSKEARTVISRIPFVVITAFVEWLIGIINTENSESLDLTGPLLEATWFMEELPNVIVFGLMIYLSLFQDTWGPRKSQYLNAGKLSVAPFIISLLNLTGIIAIYLFVISMLSGAADQLCGQRHNLMKIIKTKEDIRTIKHSLYFMCNRDYIDDLDTCMAQEFKFVVMDERIPCHKDTKELYMYFHHDSDLTLKKGDKLYTKHIECHSYVTEGSKVEKVLIIHYRKEKEFAIPEDREEIIGMIIRSNSKSEIVGRITSINTEKTQALVAWEISPYKMGMKEQVKGMEFNSEYVLDVDVVSLEQFPPDYALYREELGSFKVDLDKVAICEESEFPDIEESVPSWIARKDICIFLPQFPGNYSEDISFAMQVGTICKVVKGIPPQLAPPVAQTETDSDDETGTGPAQRPPETDEEDEDDTEDYTADYTADNYFVIAEIPAPNSQNYTVYDITHETQRVVKYEDLKAVDIYEEDEYAKKLNKRSSHKNLGQNVKREAVKLNKLRQKLADEIEKDRLLYYNKQYFCDILQKQNEGPDEQPEMRYLWVDEYHIHSTHPMNIRHLGIRKKKKSGFVKISDSVIPLQPLTCRELEKALFSNMHAKIVRFPDKVTLFTQQVEAEIIEEEKKELSYINEIEELDRKLTKNSDLRLELMQELGESPIPDSLVKDTDGFFVFFVEWLLRGDETEMPFKEIRRSVNVEWENLGEEQKNYEDKAYGLSVPQYSSPMDHLSKALALREKVKKEIDKSQKSIAATVGSDEGEREHKEFMKRILMVIKREATRVLNNAIQDFEAMKVKCEIEYEQSRKTLRERNIEKTRLSEATPELPGPNKEIKLGLLDDELSGTLQQQNVYEESGEAVLKVVNVPIRGDKKGLWGDLNLEVSNASRWREWNSKGLEDTLLREKRDKLVLTEWTNMIEELDEGAERRFSGGEVLQPKDIDRLVEHWEKIFNLGLLDRQEEKKNNWEKFQGLAIKYAWWASLFSLVGHCLNFVMTEECLKENIDILGDGIPGFDDGKFSLESIFGLQVRSWDTFGLNMTQSSAGSDSASASDSGSGSLEMIEDPTILTYCSFDQGLKQFWNGHIVGTILTWFALAMNCSNAYGASCAESFCNALLFPLVINLLQAFFSNIFELLSKFYHHKGSKDRSVWLSNAHLSIMGSDGKRFKQGMSEWIDDKLSLTSLKTFFDEQPGAVVAICEGIARHFGWDGNSDQTDGRNRAKRAAGGGGKYTYEKKKSKYSLQKGGDIKSLYFMVDVIKGLVALNLQARRDTSASQDAISELKNIEVKLKTSEELNYMAIRNKLEEKCRTRDREIDKQHDPLLLQLQVLSNNEEVITDDLIELLSDKYKSFNDDDYDDYGDYDEFSYQSIEKLEAMLRDLTILQEAALSQYDILCKAKGELPSMLEYDEVREKHLQCKSDLELGLKAIEMNKQLRKLFSERRIQSCETIVIMVTNILVKQMVSKKVRELEYKCGGSSEEITGFYPEIEKKDFHEFSTAAVDAVPLPDVKEHRMRVFKALSVLRVLSCLTGGCISPYCNGHIDALEQVVMGEDDYGDTIIEIIREAIGYYLYIKSVVELSVLDFSTEEAHKEYLVSPMMDSVEAFMEAEHNEIESCWRTSISRKGQPIIYRDAGSAITFGVVQPATTTSAVGTKPFRRDVKKFNTVFYYESGDFKNPGIPVKLVEDFLLETNDETQILTSIGYVSAKFLSEYEREDLLRNGDPVAISEWWAIEGNRHLPRTNAQEIKVQMCEFLAKEIDKQRMDSDNSYIGKLERKWNMDSEKVSKGLLKTKNSFDQGEVDLARLYSFGGILDEPIPSPSVESSGQAATEPSVPPEIEHDTTCFPQHLVDYYRYDETLVSHLRNQTFDFFTDDSIQSLKEQWENARDQRFESIKRRNQMEKGTIVYCTSKQYKLRQAKGIVMGHRIYDGLIVVELDEIPKVFRKQRTKRVVLKIDMLETEEEIKAKLHEQTLELQAQADKMDEIIRMRAEARGVLSQDHFQQALKKFDLLDIEDNPDDPGKEDEVVDPTSTLNLDDLETQMNNDFTTNNGKYSYSLREVKTSNYTESMLAKTNIVGNNVRIYRVPGSEPILKYVWLRSTTKDGKKKYKVLLTYKKPKEGVPIFERDETEIITLTKSQQMDLQHVVSKAIVIVERNEKGSEEYENYYALLVRDDEFPLNPQIKLYLGDTYMGLRGGSSKRTIKKHRYRRRNGNIRVIKKNNKKKNKRTDKKLRENKSNKKQRTNKKKRVHKTKQRTNKQRTNKKRTNKKRTNRK